MDTVINDFVQVLRDHRVRVSPAESIDAMLALEQVGLGERGLVRDTLRSTLIKNLDDIGTFERLFDLYFNLQETAEKQPVRPHLHDHDHGGSPSQLQLGEEAEGEEPESDDHSHEDNDPVDLRRYFGEENMAPSENIHQDPDRMRLSMLSQQLILNRKQGPLNKALERLTHQLKMRRVRGMFNPGKLAPHDAGGQELPIDISAVELEHLVDHLHELEVDEDLIRQIEEQSDDILAGLAEMIQQMIERQKNLQNKELEALDPNQRSLLKLSDFSPGEQREMEGAIRRLARQIHGAKTRRLKRDRTGRISVAHTLRNNVRYEGIPFDPVLRRHREQKPRVTLLCDISLSMRNLARFWLHLVYQMQSLFSKVRTFVFVADVAEVTQLFEEQPMRRAVETIFGGSLIDADVNSDFGLAAERFRNEYLPTINHRTTVVILGDGRNNGKDPNVRALEEIAQHAKQLIWMTPEPKWGWHLGSCDMPRYEPLCNRVEVVRTVDQLASVAEELVKTRA
ncbi:MAG: VWA domain-containing protein [Actinomycetota bacterium]|nr:VWA domain-containing protein [Actinomycetota bacterium]